MGPQAAINKLIDKIETLTDKWAHNYVVVSTIVGRGSDFSP